MPLIGIVDAKAWRIIANYTESYIRGFAVGDTAWVAQFQCTAPSPRENSGHRARRQPRAGADPAVELCRADHRLDPPAAPFPGDADAGRSGAGSEALHGRRRARAGAAANGLAAEFISPLREAAVALRREIADIEIRSARDAHCARATLAVALSVITALALRLDAPWWAAISAFVSIQITAPSSIGRGALRIIGTAIGAAIAVLLSPWLIEDQVAVSLVLFVASAIAALGLQVSAHGYAFMLGGVTLDMVLLASLDDPASVLSVACNRTAEVTVGTVAAVLVAIVLSPPAQPMTHRPAPGRSDLLGAQWPSVERALRAGLGVMLVPWIWNLLELQNLSRTAITVAAIMAVQATTDDEVANRRQVVLRATHCVFGCLIGGTVGLALLSLSFESFVPWLLALCAGVWIGAQIQSSARGIGYVGTQGTAVFMMTLVQGFGPPVSILASALPALRAVCSSCSRCRFLPASGQHRSDMA